MAQNGITEYVAAQRAQGAADDAIRSALLAAGWDAVEVDQAFQGGGMPETGVEEGGSSSSREYILVWVLGIAVFAFLILSGFLYFENISLTGKISALTGEASSMTQQISDLQASSSRMAMQLATTTGMLELYIKNLSFYALPPGMASIPTKVSLYGTVAGGNGEPFVITSPAGARITVENSSDPNLVAALQPLLGSATSTHYSGIYTPGIDRVTLTGIGSTTLE